MLAMQVLYHLHHTTSPIFEIGCHFHFAWTGLKP
jgi:hypothetical protein